MQQTTKNIVWFDEVTKVDIPLVGGKGANLGEMVHAKIPVPPGFIVTAEAYFKFLAGSGLADEIRRYLENLNVNDSKRLQEVAELIKDKISRAPIPPNMVKEIKQAYR
ncbi:MAG TPA: PEP/pyruvate-binding domain-containing protein, partial [Dehalococcoidia bacterium]